MSTGPGRVRVEPPAAPGVPRRPGAARAASTRARTSAVGSGRRSGRVASVRPDRRDVADDVDPVGDRPGDLAAVVAALHLGARAPVARAASRVEVAARARVARPAPPCPGPGRRADSSPRAIVDLAALQRLAQRLDDVGAEERELVEEQHAAVGAADLAGTDPAAAAAEQAGLAGVVVRRRERRADQHRRRRARARPRASGSRSAPATPRGVRSGRSPGIRSASWSCRRPWGRTSSRWWPPAAATSTA